MDEHRWIAVSPQHDVRLATEYQPLLDRPSERDFIVHTIERREANGLPLMTAEIVIAGSHTRAEYPLATQYPLHFRKTYFAARLHGDPRVEYERSAEASALIGLPPPIGYTDTSFRSCLIPGSPYPRLTPFDSESEDANLRRAGQLSLRGAAGLWKLAEEAHRALTRLHAGGLAHGDAELQNFIVCPAPLAVWLVDFETAVRRDELDEAAWEARCFADETPLLKEAIFLQTALGRQRGELADRAWTAAPRLFRDAERLRRAIVQLATLR